MKRISIILFVLTIVSQLIFSSCRKHYPACDMENPIKDLPWLVKIINNCEERAQIAREHGYKPPEKVRIYQSTYKDGTCFLLEESSASSIDGGYLVLNCEGETLCFFIEYDDGTCLGYDIDFNNKKLIWKSK